MSIQTIQQTTHNISEGFKSIRGAPSELYLTFFLKFLDSFSYFSFSLIFTLFLTEDFGYSDIQAGTIYGGWGALVTLFGLLTGVVVDGLGVSKSLKIGFALQLVAKCVIFYTDSRITLMVAIGALSLGGCLGIPVLSIGIRRYTNTKNRGFAYGLFYCIMNVAALLSGPIVDFCTILYKNTGEEHDRQRLAQDGGYSDKYKWSLSGYRLIVLLGILTNILACFATLYVKEIKACDSDLDSSEENEGSNRVQEFRPDETSKREMIRETFRSKNFKRFLAVIMITVNVRMIFRHLDATLPKYMVREFGENVAKGTIYSINPLLIIILVPIVTAGTSHIDPLVMIHHGSYISAASVFVLAAFTSVPACVAFVIILSIGEAVWSPRLYDYANSMAKEGREGTYMALSSAPLFLVKLPVGMMSGYLLQTFCPEEGPRNSKLMWLIIGLATASSPVLLTVCWKYISKKEVEDEEEIALSVAAVPDEEMTPLAEIQKNHGLMKRPTTPRAELVSMKT